MNGFVEVNSIDFCSQNTNVCIGHRHNCKVPLLMIIAWTPKHKPQWPSTGNGHAICNILIIHYKHRFRILQNDL